MEKVKRGASPYWSGDKVTMKSKSKVTTVHVKATWLLRFFTESDTWTGYGKTAARKTRGVVK